MPRAASPASRDAAVASESAEAGAPTRDLRLLAPASAAWSGALVGGMLGGRVHTGVAVVVLVVLVVLVAALATTGLTRSAGVRTVAATLLVSVVLALVALLRVAGAVESPVAGLARDRSLAEVRAVVRSDPRVVHGRFADRVVYRVRTERVVTAAGTTTARVPVVVMSDADVPRPAYASTVRLSGRLAPSEDPATAAFLDVREVAMLSPPSAAHRAAERVRAGVRTAAAVGPSPGSALVPALVDGDDARMPAGLVDDFRTSGLTHLTAVSGANFTLVLAFVLPVARRLGVRARGLLLVGLLCSLAFVLLARPEPSVLRAAVMGAVGLVGLGVGGRRLAIRALSASVVVLLAVSPGLAGSAGFALSVLATGGILLGAPPLRRALAQHVPGMVADAVAVPVAAQLACTPLVAVLSAQVSLVAVAANLAAAPFVGPTTVLGLVGGLLSTVWAPLGWAAGWVAAWCAQAIVEVAEVSAELPGAAVDWGTTPVALVLLSGLCVALLVLLPRLLRRRRVAVAVAVLLLAAVLQPFPAGGGWLGRLWPGGWPPPDWVMVACDVGQGDAIVLRAGPASAVVVDAGPDPRLVDRCLARLGVREVPAVVLTHFHADHVDGLEGVLRGRRVGEVQVTGLPEPEYGAAYVRRTAQERGVPVRVPAYGEMARAGPLTWQVVGPHHLVDDNPNDASLVLLVAVRGLRLLLAGDVEPASQAPLTRVQGLAPVDVLKVPHHGSAHQDDRLLQSLGASLALVSVGEDNDYGHPADRTVALLRAAGATVHRTDTDGDLAVVVGPDGPRVVGRG